MSDADTTDDDGEPLTNTANPHHNPENPHDYPKKPDQWDDAELTDSVNPSTVDSSQWMDSRHIPYDPTAGSKSPTGGRCNAPLDNYEERYGERRYCGQLPVSHFKPSVDHDYCKIHKKRAQLDVRAEELLQHGLSARSRDHVYRKLPDWQRLYLYGLFESLMDLSVHEFATEYELKEFDFSDAPFNPPIREQSGPIYHVEVPHATENLDREVALWGASVDGVKMELANATIIDEEMTVETADHAQLTSPTDSDPTQEYKTIEAVEEHPLNLAYSRLVSDRTELLKYGGIPVDGELSNDRSSIGDIDSLTVVQADTSDESPMADKAHRAGIDADSV